jgi:DNA-binding XRE family transcriptional regulator
MTKENIVEYEEKPVNTRFIQAMKHFRYNKNSLATALGVSPPSIGHIEKHRNFPGFEVILKFLELHPEINANWLITGEGQMIKSPRNIDAEINDMNRQIRILNENNDWKARRILKLERIIREIGGVEPPED